MATGLSRDELNSAEVLSDDVLLDIFGFYAEVSSNNKQAIEAWRTLVHVCRRWRRLAFQSSRRLNLRLFCKPETRTKDTLHVWPALPIIVYGEMAMTTSGIDNIIVALEQHDRVHDVQLWGLSGWQLQQVSAAMQAPFPELTNLLLSSRGSMLPVLTGSFLGGSAPNLLRIELNGIPFSGLPNLLLSATRLVELSLHDVSPWGYISPEAMVASLSMLSSLKSFHIEFEFPQFHPGWDTRRPAPSKRSVLPALDRLSFQGNTEYLEDFVSRIDTPQLDHLGIASLYHIDFNLPRLSQFINRTPERSRRNKAHLHFDDWSAGVLLGILQIYVMCKEPNQQLLFVGQVCGSSISSTVEDLYINRRLPHLSWKDDDIENTLWLQILLPFSAVKNLYIYRRFAPSIAAALQELVGDRLTEVLPSLQNIFVEELEPFQESIAQFVVARQLSGRPVAISEWDRD